jgi:hypothetical protein
MANTLCQLPHLIAQQRYLNLLLDGTLEEEQLLIEAIQHRLLSYCHRQPRKSQNRFLLLPLPTDRLTHKSQIGSYHSQLPHARKPKLVPTTPNRLTHKTQNRLLALPTALRTKPEIDSRTTYYLKSCIVQKTRIFLNFPRSPHVCPPTTSGTATLQPALA